MGIVSPEGLEDLLDEIEKELVGVRSFSITLPRNIRRRIHEKINRLERDMFRRAGASGDGDPKFFEMLEYAITAWSDAQDKDDK
jgi:hypothetical protein